MADFCEPGDRLLGVAEVIEQPIAIDIIEFAGRTQIVDVLLPVTIGVFLFIGAIAAMAGEIGFLLSPVPLSAWLLIVGMFVIRILLRRRAEAQAVAEAAETIPGSDGSEIAWGATFDRDDPIAEQRAESVTSEVAPESVATDPLDIVE